MEGNHFHSEDRSTTHLQAQVLHRRRFAGEDGASHVLQIGADFQRFELDGTLNDGTILVFGAEEQLLQRIDFARQSELDQTKSEWSLFAQDRWTHSARFWLDFGLRYSSDSHAGDHRFAPRIGAAWDPIGDRRTLIKGGAGIVFRRVYLGELAWEQLPARLETTFDGEGGATLQGLVPRIDDDLDAPRTIQITGEISHRLASGWLLRGRYSERITDRNIIVDRIDGPGVRLPPGFLATGIDPSELGPVGTLLLTSTGDANTRSFELTAARRIPTGGEFVVSYVNSSSSGDLNDFTVMTAEFPQPIVRPNRRGQRPFDATHRVVAWGTFELPSEVLITPVVEWRTGFPYSVFAGDQSYLGEPNTERFPNFFALDLQATKSIEIKGYRITGGVKVSNITGHDNPRQVVSNFADAGFGDLRNSVPLRVRAKFSFRF